MHYNAATAVEIMADMHRTGRVQAGTASQHEAAANTADDVRVRDAHREIAAAHRDLAERYHRLADLYRAPYRPPAFTDAALEGRA